VVIIPPRADLQDQSSKTRELLSILLAELPLKQAVKLACQLTKENKNELYEMALALKA
jgi:16S rRNA (cytidine1402-2'-O)-methyltransferase